MDTTTQRALGISMLLVVALACWMADFIGLFAISGSTAFGGDPLSSRQQLASRLVFFEALAIAIVLVCSVVAISKRWMRAWWALWAVAAAMASITTFVLAAAGPIAASGECTDWAIDRDCGLSSQIRRDHVAAGLAAIALALVSITFALLAHRSARTNRRV